MKLLLTSNGLSNQSTANALFDLVGKKADEISIAFIPTASNISAGDKDWLIDDLVNIRNQNFKCIDIVDISALPKEVWLPRFQTADILFFSGGDTNHLMNWIEKSGLKELIPDLLKTKVWAGISAGSMVTNPSLALSSKDKKIYYEENFGYKSEIGLSLVNFFVRPHYRSEFYVRASKEYLEDVAKDIPGLIYALDDQSALKVIDGKVEIISEGEVLILNE